MLRRDIFRAGLAGAAGLFGFHQASAAASEDRLKVAYHLSDADKVNFVLGNIKNHYEGTGGNVEIVLVVHGPALAAFKAKSASGATSSRFAGLVQQGLVPQACGNTLRGMDIAVTDLLAGFQVADKGGVVKLAELQRQGYVYLRP
ncbi:DsrE family protein [Mesorhizobium dulcispinae]|uniref:DsrE family protein n=1 Tax=Mesorhizobium dulcispinae TaxID=3072316 RepID=UPI002A242CDB|nr:DsrE family protein [Mesorhizobium sp. VK23D]MDX8519837.1 DsrE family protein [Mesorhizobium sp. VK23D]